MLDELVKQALVGTGRAAPTPPRADGPLAEALQLAAGGAGPSPEARLLAAAAVLCRYEACGRTPSATNAAAGGAAVAPAPDDAKPHCSRRAADLLGQLLGMSNTPAKQALLHEWLDLAALARRRAPHRLLPALLEYGASYRPLRQSVADAADARGAWLMGLNPRWRISAGDADGQQELPWDTGVAEQRVATLRRLRGSDPAAARRLIESTWKQDGADERARFVETMRVGLSGDDEPFLEAALNDRSKQVRAAAVDALARLPASAFVDRMVRRAEPLLKLTAASAGAPVRKGTSAALEVALPPEKFDESWERDGITPKAEERMGQRQWRLMQVLSHVPPAHWSKSWNAAPAELVAAAAASEHRGLLLTAWTNAAVRNPDPEWAAALLRGPSGAQDDPRHRQGRQELLRSMRPTDRLSVLAEILESSTAAASFDAATAWIQAADFPLDRRAAAAAFAVVERRVAATNGYDYAVGHALEQLALVVPSDLHDELAARWTGAAWDQNRKALDRFFQTLGMRRDIQREFTT